MENVTTTREMRALLNSSLYIDVSNLMGRLKNALFMLDDVGDCVFNLEDAIDRGECEGTDGEVEFDRYIDSAERFFDCLDELNLDYDELRRRVLKSLVEEYDKIALLIAYRDSMIVERLNALRGIISEDDWNRMQGYLVESRNVMNKELLRSGYDYVLDYLGTLDDVLSDLNEFGENQDDYDTAYFDGDAIVNFNNRFYITYKNYNALIGFTDYVNYVGRYVTLVVRLLNDKYGIDIDEVYGNE